ncbi:MAG TPA: YihY/virulence factor BrkB family protein [Candidatus Limnocylindria bacterium]|nr:YihY/virulence factor BrkB family protein [Candidatus Limnocylindria bacterium]
MTLRKHTAQTWAVVKRTGGNFYRDNGFFLAMGLAFNLLLYFVPLILLITSILGYTILESERAMVEVQSVARQFLPHSEQAFADNLEAIVKNRGLLGLVGFCFFLIFSSTLFGSVRHVLNIVFKAEYRRGFVHGVGRDFLMMLITALLLVLAITVASVLAIARAFGAEPLPFMTPVIEMILSGMGKLFALLFLFAIFYVLYRFAPTRTLHGTALLIASLSSTILFELARWAFVGYIAFARETLAVYGALAGLMLFFFWLYYASIIFVLGAEIGFACDRSRQAAP